MCVIAIVSDTRPNEQMVRNMWNSNSDGGGVAWRDVSNEQHQVKTPVVKWKKGLNLAEMQDMAASLPMPFIMHFRKKSIGEITPLLCHPFEVSPNSPLLLEGETEGYVLFHNGTFKDWSQHFFNFITQRGMNFPQGQYSDSRALAIMASNAGVGIMDFLGAKGVAFSPLSTEVFEGTNNIEDWKKVEGIWVSNNKFVTPEPTRIHQNTYPMQGGGINRTPHQQLQDLRAKKTESRIYCKSPACIEKTGLDADGFCAAHPKKNSTPLALPAPKSVKESSVEFITPETRRSKKEESPYKETVDMLREVATSRGYLEAASLALAALHATPPRLSRSQWKRLMGEFAQAQARERKQKVQQLEQTFSQLVN